MLLVEGCSFHLFNQKLLRSVRSAAFNCLPRERDRCMLVEKREHVGASEDSDKAMSKMPKIPAEDVLHRRQGDDFCLMRKSVSCCWGCGCGESLPSRSSGLRTPWFSTETEKRKCLKSISWALIASIPCGIVCHLLSTCSRSVPSPFSRS